MMQHLYLTLQNQKPVENSNENSVNAENSNSTTSEEDSYKKMMFILQETM